jgi:hypothetical protein|tara:strand:- start:206 stop:628 length:423 start_codon:yes stop_codon:yes gene_type:complete
MKSSKYFAGGLIKGSGGKALKSFMKSDLYKNLKSEMVKRVDKLYSKSVPIVGKSTVSQRSNYLKGLKKLDLKSQKAQIIEKAMGIAKDTKSKIGKDIPRPIKAALLKGARNIGKYHKKIEQQGRAYLLKGERMVKGKRDN